MKEGRKDGGERRKGRRRERSRKGRKEGKVGRSIKC